ASRTTWAFRQASRVVTWPAAAWPRRGAWGPRSCLRSRSSGSAATTLIASLRWATAARSPARRWWSPPGSATASSRFPTPPDWLGAAVMRDKAGFVLSGREVLDEGKAPPGWGTDREPFLLEASVPGVFVAGDVRYRSVKRIASAVGEGSMAVQFVHQYLATLLGARP